MKSKTTFETMRGYGAKFFFCNCAGHALLVERWDDEICLGMWGQTGLSCYPSNLWERIRLTWAFLRGRLFVDDIILTRSEAKLLADQLKELANETINNTKKLASSVRKR